MAIWKDTIFVMDPGVIINPDFPSRSGAVYVFVRPGTGWKDMTQTARLTFSYNTPNMDPISPVALAVDEGVVFVKPTLGWIDAQETTLLSSPDWNVRINNYLKRHFGTSLAVDNGVLVVGAPEYYGMEDRSHDGLATIYSGMVYLYKRPAQGWGAVSAPDARLTNDDADAYSFGQSVDIQGDTVAASARIWKETFTPIHNWERTAKWRVFVFARPSGGWVTRTDSATLAQSDGIESDWFAQAGQYYLRPIRVFGDMVVVGCPACNKNDTTSAGAVYLFSEPALGWDLGPDVVNETAKIWSREPKARGYFGATLAVEGTPPVNGAPTAGDAAIYASQPLANMEAMDWARCMCSKRAICAR